MPLVQQLAPALSGSSSAFRPLLFLFYSHFVFIQDDNEKNRPLFKERFSPGWMGRGHGFTSFFPCWPRKRRQRPKPQPRSR